MPIFTATSSCNTVASSTGSTECGYIFYSDASTSPAYAGGFSYGEIVISVEVFGLLLIVAYAVLWFRVRGIRIRQ